MKYVNTLAYHASLFDYNAKWRASKRKRKMRGMIERIFQIFLLLYREIRKDLVTQEERTGQPTEKFRRFIYKTCTYHCVSSARLLLGEMRSFDLGVSRDSITDPESFSTLPISLQGSTSSFVRINLICLR